MDISNLSVDELIRPVKDLFKLLTLGSKASEGMDPDTYARCFYQFTGDPEDYLIATLINQHMKGERVLDLGCGPVVPITSLFFPQAKTVIAVDFSQNVLDYAQNAESLEKQIRAAKQHRDGGFVINPSNPTIEFRLGDFTKDLGFNSEFDSVMQIGGFGCVQHNKDFFGAVRLAHKYLKPGGTLLMMNWIEEGEKGSRFSFGGRVNERELYQPSLQQAGFQIDRIEEDPNLLGQASREAGYSSLIYALATKKTL